MKPITNSAAFRRAIRTAVKKAADLESLVGKLDRVARKHPEWKKPEAIREDIEELLVILEDLADEESSTANLQV